jgi:hypothetical protein
VNPEGLRRYRGVKGEKKAIKSRARGPGFLLGYIRRPITGKTHMR